MTTQAIQPAPISHETHRKLFLEALHAYINFYDEPAHEYSFKQLKYYVLCRQTANRMEHHRWVQRDVIEKIAKQLTQMYNESLTDAYTDVVDAMLPDYAYRNERHNDKDTKEAIDTVQRLIGWINACIYYSNNGMQ